MTSKYLKAYNFNPWNKHLNDCSIRAIVAATGLCYEEVCRRLKLKFKNGYGLVRDSGVELYDIEHVFDEYFDIVEDYYDNQDFVPDEFKDSLENTEMDMIDATLGVDAVSNDTLEDFIELNKGQGVFLVSLVGNPEAEDQTARKGGHIVAVFCLKGKQPFFVDTWDSHEMRVDAYMRVVKREPAGSPLHFKRFWKLKSQYVLSEARHMSSNQRKRFIKRLKNGVVEFVYKKRNGKVRKAKGTLSPKNMPTWTKSWKRKSGKAAPKDSIVYFDLDKQQIRSFKDWLLMKVKK